MPLDAESLASEQDQCASSPPAKSDTCHARLVHLCCALNSALEPQATLEPLIEEPSPGSFPYEQTEEEDPEALFTWTGPEIPGFLTEGHSVVFTLSDLVTLVDYGAQLWEQEHADVSTGHDDLSTGHDGVTMGNAGVSTGNADVSTGNADVSTGNADVSTGNANVSSGRDDASPVPSFRRALSENVGARHRLVAREGRGRWPTYERAASLPEASRQPPTNALVSILPASLEVAAQGQHPRATPVLCSKCSSQSNPQTPNSLGKKQLKRGLSGGVGSGKLERKVTDPGIGNRNLAELTATAAPGSSPCRKEGVKSRRHARSPLGQSSLFKWPSGTSSPAVSSPLRARKSPIPVASSRGVNVSLAQASMGIRGSVTPTRVEIECIQESSGSRNSSSSLILSSAPKDVEKAQRTAVQMQDPKARWHGLFQRSKAFFLPSQNSLPLTTLPELSLGPAHDGGERLRASSASKVKPKGVARARSNLSDLHSSSRRGKSSDPHSMAVPVVHAH